MVSKAYRHRMERKKPWLIFMQEYSNMDNLDRTHKTWLCTVVFLDIVGYSKEPVAQQLDMKESLNGFISRAITQVARQDRIILDTGDGAALCFMGDPEDALFVALQFRELLWQHLEHDPHPMHVRIGVNLGPVRVVKDINGQLNVIGDGINVAQRVMNFAEANQILVSRSFYEVISCLSKEYDQLFHYRGLKKDKHIREHAVYEVMATGQEQLAEAEHVVAACEPEHDPASVNGQDNDHSQPNVPYSPEGRVMGKRKLWKLAAVIGALGLTVGIAVGGLAGSKNEVMPIATTSSRQAQLDRQTQLDRQAEIDALLISAQTALADYRLTEPDDDSAYYYYQKILHLDPGNSQATTGFSLIADRYLELAKKKFNDGWDKKARHYVELGLRVKNDHAALLAFRDRLAEQDGSVSKSVGRLFRRAKGIFN